MAGNQEVQKIEVETLEQIDTHEVNVGAKEVEAPVGDLRESVANLPMSPKALPKNHFVQQNLPDWFNNNHRLSGVE